MWEQIWAVARCEEASTLSRGTYIPCMAPAVAIVHHGRRERGYFMCLECAEHNVRNRSGVYIIRKGETDMS